MNIVYNSFLFFFAQVDSPLVLEETVGDNAVNLTAPAPEAVVAEGDQPEQTEQVVMMAVQNLMLRQWYFMGI